MRKNILVVFIKIFFLVSYISAAILLIREERCKKLSPEYEKSVDADEFAKQAEIVNATLEQFIKPILINFLSRIHILIALYGSISAFFDIQKIIKREILTGAYSTTTYFISLTVYNMLIDLILPIIAIASIAIYNFKCVTQILVITCFSCSLLTIPIGMALGSIAGNKIITLVISNIMILPAYSIAPDIGRMQRNTWKIVPLNNYKWIRFLFYISYIFPTTHLSAAVNHFAYKHFFNYIIKDSVNKPDALEYLDYAVDSCEDSHNYIYNFCPSVTAIIIMFLSLASLYTMFGIFRQAGILMPRVRMKLEKK